MGRVLAAYGGGFKPPTAGHFEIVKKALSNFPEIDEFIVYVGGKERDGIDQAEAILVWEIYENYLANKVDIQPAVAPMKDILNLAKENPQDIIYFILGYREGRDDDMRDISDRSKLEEKYPNLIVKTIGTSDGGMSGTNARKALNNEEEFIKFIPPEVKEKSEIWNIVRKAITENTPQDGKAAPYGSGYDEVEEGRKKKKDPKTGKGKKPKGSKRRLYTDEDPKDTIGIKFSTRQDIVDTLNKKSFKAKSHARQSQIINLIHQRVRAAYGRAKDPKVKKRLKTGLDYITDKKEASKAKTQRLKKLKEGEDFSPLGYAKKIINGDISFRDAMKESGISFGNLSSLLKKLDAEHLIQTSYNLDSLSEEIVGSKIHCNNCDWSWEIKDGGADLFICHKCNHDNTEYIEKQKFTINENATYTKKINLIDILATFTQHMLDIGMNISPLPKLEFVDGDSENASQFLGKTAYYDPNTQTIVLYTEGRHPKDITRSYAHEMIHHMQNLEDRLGNIQTTNTQEDDHLNNIEAEANLKGTMTFRNWTDTIKEDKDYFGLNKIVKEIVNEPKYKIFSDMDGVLTDFDKSFLKYSEGIPPREYEKTYGKEKFWELIDGKGKVGFWVGMPWMEDGKQYWDYIKNYDTELLSSPSRSSTSRLGKRLWVRNNMPGIKLTLAQAAKKQNYAAPNHILIDDRPSNIEQWRAQGGIGILHTSAADTISQLKKLGL